MPRRSYTTDSKARNALSVYLNPHSVATTVAKIPDGKATLSSGVRLQNVLSLSPSDNSVVTIALYPGLLSGVVVSDNANIADETRYPFQYSNHIVPSFKNAQESSLGAGNQLISRWRVVSQSTKIMLTNDYSENDGWFEAIRLPYSHDQSKRIYFESNLNPGVARDEPPTTFPYGYTDVPVLPDTGVGQGSSFIEHPTYVSGKLREIGRYVFQLKPSDTDHDFTFKTFDDNYGMVLIRIHGDSQSKLVLHTVCNQELQFTESSFMSRYHTPSVKDLAGLKRSQNILLSDIKAARKVLRE